MKTQIMTLVILLGMISLASAVTLDVGTFVNTTVSNLTINFTQIGYVDRFQAEERGAYFWNYSRNNGTNTITMNISETNTDYTSPSLPYFSSTETLSKTITSGLSSGLTTTIIFEQPCGEIGRISYTSASGTYSEYLDGRDYCSNGIVILTGIGIENGANELTIGGCSSTERVTYNLIKIFGALMILVGSFYFIYRNGLLEEMTVGQLIIVFILIVVSIALYVASVDIMAGRCPV